MLLLPGMLLAAFILVFTAVLCSLILLFSFWLKGEVMQMKAGSFGLQTNKPWPPRERRLGREREGNGQHLSVQLLRLWASSEGWDRGTTAWAGAGERPRGPQHLTQRGQEEKAWVRQGCLPNILLTCITPLPALRIKR